MLKEHEMLVSLLQELLRIENDDAVKLAAAIEELVDAKISNASDARDRPGSYR
jgi:hypothetical protein